MISRSLICFSLASAVASSGAYSAEVTGRVSLRDSREASVAKSAGFSGVVVSLEPLDARAAPAPPTRAAMVQKNKTFSPHVLPVQVGATVEFPNYDPIFHNAFSSYSGQIFDVGLYRPGSTRSVRFNRPGVVRVFCNIHPHMSAIILVVAGPYFAKTGPDGRFAIDVPPGRYQLRVFHERATEATLTALGRTIQVDSRGFEFPPIAISEAGYLPAPHANKYGQPYPPAPDDGSVYPGVRK